MPLYGAGVMIAITIGAAAIGRWEGPAGRPDPSSAVATRDLRFQDQPDGAIEVLVAGNGAADQPLEVLAPGTNGFLRATMRGLAKERRRDDAGDRPPFRLTEWADGRLTLEDRATGRRIDLEAFGVTNESVFARLLTEAPPSP